MIHDLSRDVFIYLHHERLLLLSIKSDTYLQKKNKRKGKIKKKIAFWPLGMYFIAMSSLVSLLRINLATPKFPEPISFNSSYFSISLSSSKSINFTREWRVICVKFSNKLRLFLGRRRKRENIKRGSEEEARRILTLEV